MTLRDPLHVVCPHCHTTNRVHSADLAKSPDRARFERKPVALDEAAFDRHVTRGDLPVLVDFWAPWCGPCRMMAPAFEQAAAQLEPHMRLAKVNTDESGTLGARYAIRSIPTLALFVNGREVARQAGAMGAGDIVRWARSHFQVA